MLSFGEKIVKIGPVDPQIISLQEIIKNINKKLEMYGKVTAQLSFVLLAWGRHCGAERAIR